MRAGAQMPILPNILPNAQVQQFPTKPSNTFGQIKLLPLNLNFLTQFGALPTSPAVQRQPIEPQDILYPPLLEETEFFDQEFDQLGCFSKSFDVKESNSDEESDFMNVSANRSCESDFMNVSTAQRSCDPDNRTDLFMEFGNSVSSSCEDSEVSCSESIYSQTTEEMDACPEFFLDYLSVHN